MPSSPPEVLPGAEGLRAYLKSVLPNARLIDAAINPAYQPIVLLQTKHLMAGFAFSNGDTRKSYDALYGSFKNYYAERRVEWDSLDVAFVFCVRPNVPNLDRFCSKIETDVYFCRKFVVPLSLPLAASLARLPFLPLTPLDGLPFRPASAQTFLQKCGVPAVLARYLVVQRERGPDGIVEECVTGTFGEPGELTRAASAPVAYPERADQPIRLEMVAIKDFRAYRKQQAFAIGEDVTVLYGPNGFGKTSFFDAVDFAVTGGIGRFKSSREARFKKIARHLDSKPDESAVSLSVLCNGVVRKVTRQVSDPKHALLDGLGTERKEILSELTGGDIPATDRVENFVSLFRATHLFSQEQQELAENFQDDCRLPEQVVSRMLAFEDYSSAVIKAGRVREAVRAAINTANKQIRELSEQIADAKREIGRLNKVAQQRGSAGALESEISSVRQRLTAEGISVTLDTPDVAIVRGWRASLEVLHAESHSRSARLSSLAKDATGLPRLLTDLTSAQQQVAKADQVLGVVNERKVAAEAGLQRAQQRLTETVAKVERVRSRATVLEWVRTTKPGYARLLDRIRDLNEELNHTTAMLQQQSASEEKAAGAFHTVESHAEQVNKRLAAKRAEAVTVQALGEIVAEWQAGRKRLAAVAEFELELLRSLESLRAEEQDTSPQVAALGSEVARLSNQIAEVDTGQSQLKRLLSQLQRHVRSGSCPLCGHDHGSKDDLIRRIQEHVAADAASGTRVELARVKERASQLSDQIAENRQKQHMADTHLGSLRDERIKLATQIANFENSAVKLGVTIEASGPTPAEQLQTLNNRVQHELGDLNGQAQEAGAALEGARAVLAEVRTLLDATVVEVNRQTALLMRLQEEANRLRNDARSVQVSLDIEPEKLVELEQLNSQELAGFDAEMAKAAADEAQYRAQVHAFDHESSSLRAHLSSLRTRMTSLQETVTQITARIAESGLPSDANEEAILALIADESRAQSRLSTLRDSVSNLELAIDAATTAAVLARQIQNVRNIEKALSTAMRKRDQHQPWLGYFEELSRLVSSQQNEAIASFTREYGPRTSVIQQRLRSVYGFDEIEIQSQESTISVRVKRRGEDLRPTDYFSQSQQQTLLLGLFLTACIFQTWSSLSPVFLDDPVTHFDDLNTYAFLDLIVGLLESDVGRRQFIISTCDEKLLQLARQKFRHLGKRARFYQFSAIGSEGPVVDEID